MSIGREMIKYPKKENGISILSIAYRHKKTMKSPFVPVLRNDFRPGPHIKDDAM